MRAAIQTPLGEIGRALDILNRFRDAPMGRVRLSAPSDAANHLVAPVLSTFIERYPQVELEVSVSNRMGDDSTYRCEFERGTSGLPSPRPAPSSSTTDGVAATLGGAGLMDLADIMVREERSSGAPRTVLDDWSPVGGGYLTNAWKGCLTQDWTGDVPSPLVRPSQTLTALTASGGETSPITSGRGWTPCEGEPIAEIRAGDVVWSPRDHRRRHGATPTTAMTHIAIQPAVNGSPVTWMEKVTDEQYLAGSGRSDR
jgi:hypothetical protein